MNILFVTTKGPLPINDGHSLRTYNLLCSVAAKHSVSLLSFVKFPIEYLHISELKKICLNVSLISLPENNSKLRLFVSAAVNLFQSEPFVAHKYSSNGMRRAILYQLHQHDFDLVHLDMLPLGGYLKDINKPTLLNAHNVESALLKRKAETLNSGLEKRYFLNQAARLERFERMVVSKVNHVVVCSDDDRNILQSFVPDKPISVVPNGVDIDFFRPDTFVNINPKHLLFIGGMNWFPNKDAVYWFSEKIIVELHRFDPSIVLEVVGRNDGEIKLQSWNSIKMHGFVDDVRPFLERASVVIVPIRIGGGTRLKVLEAMSMEKAIVSTSIGVEGIRVEHGKNVMIADTPQEFAQCIYRVLNDAELRVRLGKAARELVHDQYQWGKIGRRLLDAYEVVLEP